jgi:hypothetical protein
MSRNAFSVLALFVVTVASSCASAPSAVEVPGRSVYYGFEGFETGVAPKRLEIGASQPGATGTSPASADRRPITLGINDAAQPGRWEVIATNNAAAGKKVLVQRDATDTRGRVPIAWVRDARFSGRVTASVAARSHETDGLADFGLAWNVQNANEYCVLHADGDKHELRAELVSISRGTVPAPPAARSVKRLGGAPFAFYPHKWYVLMVEENGGHVRCGVDGQVLFEFDLPSTMVPGSVGLCTFEGSTAEFDEFIAVGDEKK